MNDVVEDLRYALALILQHKDRVLIEETGLAGLFGSKYEVVGVRVTGADTDDPGLVLKIKRS